MPYIGNQPAEQFTSFATQEFSTSATTSYTLDHAVTNENEIALFVNNVRQQPGSGKAYTATGTALTLSAATASTDTMYCVFLGRALQTVTPATNSITNSMITDSTITSAKLTGVTQGITMADMWRVTANITSNADPISSNLERVDDASFNYIGSGMSVSSGTWTFPATGIYLVRMIGGATVVADDNVDLTLNVTTNNSSYDEVAQAYDSGDGSSTSSSNMVGEGIVDVTDTSNVKVRFKAGSIGSGSYFVGSTDLNNTYFTFIRLGDT